MVPRRFAAKLPPARCAPPPTRSSPRRDPGHRGDPPPTRSAPQTRESTGDQEHFSAQDRAWTHAPPPAPRATRHRPGCRRVHQPVRQHGQLRPHGGVQAQRPATEPFAPPPSPPWSAPPPTTRLPTDPPPTEVRPAAAAVCTPRHQPTRRPVLRPSPTRRSGWTCASRRASWRSLSSPGTATTTVGDAAQRPPIGTATDKHPTSKPTLRRKGHPRDHRSTGTHEVAGTRGPRKATWGFNIRPGRVMATPLPQRRGRPSTPDARPPVRFKARVAHSPSPRRPPNAESTDHPYTCSPSTGSV